MIMLNIIQNYTVQNKTKQLNRYVQTVYTSTCKRRTCSENETANMFSPTKTFSDDKQLSKHLFLSSILFKHSELLLKNSNKYYEIG